VRHRVAAQVEPVADDRLEIILRQPRLDQRTLRQRAHRLLAVARQPFEDRATRWIGKGCKKPGRCNGHKNP
jgi:anti-sigma factor RsiW